MEAGRQLHHGSHLSGFHLEQIRLALEGSNFPAPLTQTFGLAETTVILVVLSRQANKILAGSGQSCHSLSRPTGFFPARILALVNENVLPLDPVVLLKLVQMLQVVFSN